MTSRSRLQTAIAAATLSGLFAMPALAGNAETLASEIEQRVADIEPQVVSWRRDIHEHPELSNREVRTSGLVAKHLESLGIEVKTGIAHTGVVGILKGAKEGPVVARRADMDALPVTEDTDLPFASKVRTSFNGQEVGVAHACGHDAHVAILMGTAEVLASMKDELEGTVMFIFQPAEEGAPEGEEGGAELMLKEGLFDGMTPDAVFGLHVTAAAPAGTLMVRSGGVLASSDVFSIKVSGKQTHGGLPWLGVDPIVLSSQVVLGLQTIASRQLNVTETPSVISVGTIHGGVRQNIIPESVEMTGTIRTFSPEVREQIHQNMARTAENIAHSGGGTAEVHIDPGYPATINDAELTRRMLPTLKRIAGDDFREAQPITAAEDFAFYAQKVPGMFFNVGAAPEDPAKRFPNHNPKFSIDEKALPVGVKAMTSVALDFLSGN